MVIVRVNLALSLDFRVALLVYQALGEAANDSCFQFLLLVLSLSQRVTSVEPEGDHADKHETVKWNPQVKSSIVLLGQSVENDDTNVANHQNNPHPDVAILEDRIKDNKVFVVFVLRQAVEAFFGFFVVTITLVAVDSTVGREGEKRVLGSLLLEVLWHLVADDHVLKGELKDVKHPE